MYNVNYHRQTVQHHKEKYLSEDGRPNDWAMPVTNENENTRQKGKWTNKQTGKD